MRIEIRNYGDLLVSRPAGREALAAMLAYLPENVANEPIQLDFEGVLVVAPAWLDEVLHGLRGRFGGEVRCLPSANSSLRMSLEVLGEDNPALAASPAEGDRGPDL